MGPLKNPQHEKVAQLAATGDYTRPGAYMEVYPNASRKYAQNRVGSDWWTNSGVAGRVEFLMDGVSKGKVQLSAIQRDWVITRAARVAEHTTEIVESTDKDGNTTKIMRNAAVAVRALELLGRETEGGPTFVKETRSRRVTEDPTAEMSDEEVVRRATEMGLIPREVNPVNGPDASTGDGAGEGEGSASAELPPSSDLSTVH